MSAAVTDVDSAGFQEQIVERSRELPVLVDFWAAWCGPCRMLGPVLERLAEEPGAGFVLAKVDIDANPDLAARFAVRSIPAVKLFVDGEVAADFMGALPEPRVRSWLRQHIPSPADKEVARGRALLGAGEPEQAAAAFTAALDHVADHGAANLELARLSLSAGKVDEARRFLDAIDSRSDEREQAEQLRSALELFAVCEDAGGEDACRAALEQSPDDLDARYALGACLAAAGKHREALEELLEVVRRDKHHNDDAARKGMLVIFGLVGIRSPLADEFRDELALLL